MNPSVTFPNTKPFKSSETDKIIGTINSSPPSAAYMRQWTGPSSVQAMACRLFGAKPLPEQCWLIVNWTQGNKFQWNLKRNYIIFIQENAFENIVCQNGGNLFQGEMS